MCIHICILPLKLLAPNCLACIRVCFSLEVDVSVPSLCECACVCLFSSMRLFLVVVFFSRFCIRKVSSATSIKPYHKPYHMYIHIYEVKSALMNSFFDVILYIFFLHSLHITFDLYIGFDCWILCVWFTGGFWSTHIHQYIFNSIRSICLREILKIMKLLWQHIDAALNHYRFSRYFFSRNSFRWI